MDYAAAWRDWFMYAFYVYIALGVSMVLTGVANLIGGTAAMIAKGFSVCGMLIKCTQCALWIWVVFWLRFSQGGSVAAGKMVAECEAANPDLTAIAVVDGGPSCTGPFQAKAGKLILAWAIISCLMCK